MHTKIKLCENCGDFILNGRSDRKYCKRCQPIMKRWKEFLCFIKKYYNKKGVRYKNRKVLIHNPSVESDIFLPKKDYD